MNEKENILIGKIVGLFRAIDADNSVVLTIDDYELIKQSLLAIKAGKQLDSFIDKITNLKNRLLPDCASCLFPCGRSEDFNINEIRNDKLKAYKTKKVEILLNDPLLSKMDNNTLFFRILDLERDNNC